MPKKRSRKPFKHKWPKGWRPGIGKTKDPKDWAPSVIRDRNPIIRSILYNGALLGHTHAVFHANPNCCPLCQKHDGRRQRLKTVIGWRYPLPHPNCLCTWSTEKVVRKGEQLSRSDLLITGRKAHVFVKGPDGATMATQQLGKHREKVKVTRGGKTFYQERLVGRKEKEEQKKPLGERVKEGIKRTTKYTVGDAEKDIKAGVEKVKEKVQQVKASEAYKKTLNKIVGGLRKLKPGTKGTVEGHEVERHKDGRRFRVNGLVAHGFKATSVLLVGLRHVTSGTERAAASMGQMATGSLAAGAEMERGGQMTQDVSTVEGKAKAKGYEVAHERAKAKRERYATLTDKHNSVAKKHKARHEAAKKRAKSAEKKAQSAEGRLAKLQEKRDKEQSKSKVDRKKRKKPAVIMN